MLVRIVIGSKAYEELTDMSNEGDLEFLSDNSSYGLVIEKKVIQNMLSICRASKNLEVGGIVLGTYDSENRYALVSNISSAPIDSLRGKNWFHRGVYGLQVLLDRCWHQGRKYYLGEWHFHPYSSAIASSIDIKQMTSISTKNDYNCPEPIMIILGGNPKRDWEVRAYVFPRNKMWIELKNKQRSLRELDELA